MKNAPHFGTNLKQLSQFLIDNLASLISSVNSKREQLSAQISCNLAITEYRGSELVILLLSVTSKSNAKFCPQPSTTTNQELMFLRQFRTK
jgi:hypothetical protein